MRVVDFFESKHTIMNLKHNSFLFLTYNICFHSSQISITLCDRQLPMISKDIDTRLTTIFLPNMAHSLENFRKISEFLIFFLINQQVYSISRVSLRLQITVGAASKYCKEDK